MRESGPFARVHLCWPKPACWTEKSPPPTGNTPGCSTGGYPKVNLHPERILTRRQRAHLFGRGHGVFQYGIAHYRDNTGGGELASICAKALLVDPKRDSQSPYTYIGFPPRNHGDNDVLQAQSWMEANYAENMVIDDIARYVSISPRHFKRRFKICHRSDAFKLPSAGAYRSGQEKVGAHRSQHG